jgi:ketosteroid isomerase-like protein
MKSRLLILCLIVSMEAFAQAKNDSMEIIQLLKEDYKTMVSFDIKKHMAFCTDDYLLIENGEIWNMEKETEYYKQNAQRVIERKDNFDFKYINVLANTAYAVYNLKSEIRENGKLTQKNWNESAIFRKIDGRWKIALIHSTKT